MGWLYEEGFTKQMLTTLNCGYDTDCTVATLGSLLGILYGSDYLDPCWTETLGENLIVSHPITGFNAPKTILELTERTIAARKLVQAHYEQKKDKSLYQIPYQSYVEAYQLPVGAFKEHDLSIEILRQDHSPVFAPGEQKSITIKAKNLQNIPQQLALIPSVEGFACELAELTLDPGEEKCCSLRLTAPLEKKPLYRGWLEIRRTLGGAYWNSDFLPLNMLPSMDWLMEADGSCSTIRAAENRLNARELELNGCKQLSFETSLCLTDAGSATLKLACANPLKAYLDGELLLDCPDRTIVIPAYHRADPRKCAAFPQGSSEYRLRVEIEDAAAFEELYLMVVSPDFCWAYRIDSTFSIK